ncbi:aminotransferase class I/II-fold pyridoxal phosphate-dependent enzyme [bacterium]|nr:aminotransferase class I/II-fold pyridoxal phosphate-dependent enzyme [bacterium]
MQKILLNKNENKYGPSQKCLDTLTNAKINDLTDYTRDDNNTLRTKLSERFNVPVEQIILGYGSEDLIHRIFDTFLQPQDKVLLCSHGWYYYCNLCKKRNMQQHHYHLYRQKDNYIYNYDELHNQFNEIKPKLTIIGSPTNPTGTCFSTSEFEKTIANVRDDQILFYDIAYYGFSKEDDPPIAEWIKNSKNLVITSSFSKYFALAGVRIGYAFISSNLIDKFMPSKRLLGFSQILENVAIAALDSEDYYSDIAAKIGNDRKAIIQKINSIPGFTAFDSKANFILAEYPKEVRELFEQELDKKNVLIKFISGEPLFQNMVRISIGTQEHTKLLLEALDNLSYILEKNYADSIEASVIE